MLLCCYALFQLLPLPIAVLQVLDPTRAEVAIGLRGIVPNLHFSSLTLDSDKTCLRLSWIVGEVLTFLLIREAALRQTHRWTVAGPLLALGAIETITAIVQHAAGAPAVIGTNDNRDHLSGFLEMTLPFAIMCGLSFLPLPRAGLTLRNTLCVCFFLILAAATLVAIMFTFSKMGFVSTMGSLLVMSAIAVCAWFSRMKRWVALGVLMALIIPLVLLLPSNELMSAFGGINSDPTAEGRIPIARDTLHLIRAYPVFGSGLGTYFPAFMRYETYGVNLAWLSSHDDYLDFASELGILGLLILAIAVGATLACAVRSVFRGSTRESRLVGLACVGSFSAILIHGVADFNMHIPVNAMLFAWIAGIAVALPSATATTPRKVQNVRGFRGFLIVAGFLATAYGAGWLAFPHFFGKNLDTERIFHRFGIWDTAGALAILRHQYGGQISSVPPEKLVEYLRRDPAGPYRWEDLGESLRKAGRIGEARYCFQRAVALAPAYPNMLYRASDFYFGIGETETGMKLVVTALRDDPRDVAWAFYEYETWKIPVPVLVKSGLPPQPTVWRSYLRWLMAKRHIDEVAYVWNSMLTHAEYVDTPLATDYAAFLLRNNQPDAAAQAWAKYAGKLEKGYPDCNRIFNGGFGSQPTGSPFDWSINQNPGVTIAIDSSAAHAGSHSLRVDFDGTEKVFSIGLHQTVFLKPGRYRFQADVRLNDIVTDQGIAFHIASQRAPNLLTITTEPMLGSSDWKLIQQSFTVPPAAAGLAQVDLMRAPAFPFPSLIRGTLWIDQISLSSQ